MIDNLLVNRHRFTKPEIWDKPGLQKKQYLVITMHRSANVDETDKPSPFFKAIVGNVNNLPVIFLIYPHISSILNESGINKSNLFAIDPFG